jgi:hypothetical protein
MLVIVHKLLQTLQWRRFSRIYQIGVKRALLYDLIGLPIARQPFKNKVGTTIYPLGFLFLTSFILLTVTDTYLRGILLMNGASTRILRQVVTRLVIMVLT